MLLIKGLFCCPHLVGTIPGGSGGVGDAGLEQEHSVPFVVHTQPFGVSLVPRIGGKAIKLPEAKSLKCQCFKRLRVFPAGGCLIP